MATDTSQYYTDPSTGTTYTSKDVAAQYGVKVPPTPNTTQPPTTPNTNPPVNTSQPSPATVNATPATGTAPIQQNQQAPPVPTPTGNGTINPATGLLENPQQDAMNAALKQAQASGPAPQSAGEANPQVQAAIKNTPPTVGPNMGLVQATLSQDPGWQKLVADATNANNVATQGESLLNQYQDMVKQAGIPAIDSQLLSTKAIIDGTEQDIRNEVTAAGGFATDSQILALSSARNKTLIQNYNNLLATKANAEQQINTMIGLAGQDRQAAIQAANNQLNIDTQLNDYAQKFQSNAQEGYKAIIQAVGYNGLVNSLLNSDPSGQTLSLAESTLGFAPGSLQNVATQEKSAQNLQVIQAAGVTSPFVVTSQGEVWNSQTGYAYTSPEDFQAKTGMSLQQANAKNAIQPPPPNMDAMIKQAQLSKAQTEAQYAGAIAQANINQSNASAGASAASAAKSRSELAFEQANGGLTPAEVNAQQGAIETATQKIDSDAAGYVEKLAGGKIKWNDAFNAMKALHPDLSIQAIDNLLQSNNYRQ